MEILVSGGSDIKEALSGMIYKVSAMESVMIVALTFTFQRHHAGTTAAPCR